MRRHRFPRFAPESLERKLHPSGIAIASVSAEISAPITQSIVTSSFALTVDSSSQLSSLSTVTSAFSTDPFLSDLSGTVAVVTGPDTPGPTEPGDPEPFDPETPSDGTGPAPPDGDGTPPVTPPSIPGGPDTPSYSYF